VYVVEDETDVVKDVGYLVVVIDKCDQILPVPKVIGEEDLLGVFLGGGYRLESCVENSGPVVVDEKETDLKVLGCLDTFHCCGILRLLLATYKRREGGNETGNLPEIRGELVAKDAVSRGDRYNYRDKGLGALGEPVKLDLVKIRAELVRNSHTVGLGSVATDLESKLEIAVLGLGDRDRTGSGNERETDAAELGVYFVGDRQSFVFIHISGGLIVVEIDLLLELAPTKARILCNMFERPFPADELESGFLGSKDDQLVGVGRVDDSVINVALIPRYEGRVDVVS
jgi:hypothetical protein